MLISVISLIITIIHNLEVMVPNSETQQVYFKSQHILTTQKTYWNKNVALSNSYSR